MSNLTYFARVLKHPGFILNENLLLHPFASFYTSRRILQNNMSLFDGIQKLTGESLENLKKYANINEKIAVETSKIKIIQRGVFLAKSEFIYFKSFQYHSIASDKPFCRLYSG